MAELVDDEVTQALGAVCPIGQRLPAVLAGRYEIGEIVGEGGMGVVCRGFDVDLEETVAIKLLRAELADDDRLRARFRREVKLARRVTHPNVARVFEFGRDGTMCFLTMEFVEGESLQALLRREAPLAPARALALATALCEGLAAAHAAGVVHGDIKPGNVLIGPRRGAVVTDFGIAQALSERCGGEVTTGTPLYMAPEQARGESMVAATDVFAVGVVMCEMLTGRAPWPQGDATGMILERRAGREPDLARVSPRLPPEWAALIAECLRGSPARRPADAGALLARLAALRGGQRGPGAAETSPAALGAARWIAVAPMVAPFELAWVTADLIAALAQTRGLRVVAGASAPGVTLAGRVEGEAQALPDGVEVSLRVYAGDGADRASFTLRQPKAELPGLGAALARRIAATIDPSLAPPAASEELPPDVSDLYVQARQAYATLNFDQACEHLRAALRLSPGNRELDRALTLARVQRLSMYRDVGEAELADLCARVEAAAIEHGEHGETHLARARLALSLGDAPKAARSALAAIRRAPSLAEANVLLADLLIDIGRLPDAERRLDLALALDRRSPPAWMTRCRLWAYEGRWGCIAEAEQEIGLRVLASPMLVRMLLWRDDVAALRRIDAALADPAWPYPPRMRWAAQRVLAAGLGTEPLAAVVEDLRALFVPTSSARRNALYDQIFCELLCRAGALDEAMAVFVAAVERDALSDWQWAAHSPALAPLRDRAGFAGLRERLRARADAIAEAIWGIG